MNLVIKKCRWLFFSLWRQRAVILSNGYLTYSLRNGRELGRVSLAGARVEPSKRNSRDLSVRCAAGEVIALRASDADERDMLIRLITQAQVSPLNI